MKRHGILVHIEPVMPEFDDLDADTIQFITKAKALHDPEPDPIVETHTRWHSLNFGDLS